MGSQHGLWEIAKQAGVAKALRSQTVWCLQVDSLDKLLLRSGQELVDAAATQAATEAILPGAEAAGGAQGQHIDSATEMQVG
jgi:hypothetical protein